ncbi:MAG: TetR family transcriptional regulator C-terminal domain-containing protein, partial [Pseudonocardiaceae bacterium]|nr:TetR family transcriptional regulator C-terminal domain-containing protein [Pseudonocardiaceae bacterium]
AWTALEVEFAINARRDPAVRAELAARDKAIRDTIARLLTGYAERLGIVLPMAAADAATAVLSLGIGLGVQRAIDPSIPVRVLPEVIRLLSR